MNPAYTTIQDKLRLAELTIAQWAGVAVGGLLAVAWVMFLSPFGTAVTLFVAVYLAAVPAGAVWLAGVSEFDFAQLLRGAWRYHRTPGLFIAGGGEASGYCVEVDPHRRERRGDETADVDFADLW